MKRALLVSTITVLLAVAVVLFLTPPPTGSYTVYVNITVDDCVRWYVVSENAPVAIKKIEIYNSTMSIQRIVTSNKGFFKHPVKNATVKVLIDEGDRCFTVTLHKGESYVITDSGSYSLLHILVLPAAITFVLLVVLVDTDTVPRAVFLAVWIPFIVIYGYFMIHFIIDAYLPLLMVKAIYTFAELMLISLILVHLVARLIAYLEEKFLPRGPA